MREGFRTRLFQAHKALEGKEGVELTREEIGIRVGKALGTTAVDKNTVAAWFTRVLPPADMGAGLLVVYGVRGGWLYFGEEPREPATLEEELTGRMSHNAAADPPAAKKRTRGA